MSNENTSSPIFQVYGAGFENQIQLYKDTAAVPLWAHKKAQLIESDLDGKMSIVKVTVPLRLYHQGGVKQMIHAGIRVVIHHESKTKKKVNIDTYEGSWGPLSGEFSGYLVCDDDHEYLFTNGDQQSIRLEALWKKHDYTNAALEAVS